MNEIGIIYTMLILYILLFTEDSSIQQDSCSHKLLFDCTKNYGTNKQNIHL